MKEIKMLKVQNEFLKSIKRLFEEATTDLTSEQKDKIDTAVFSTLVLIDGCANLPKFILAPDPHKDDKEFNKSEGRDWYPENLNSNVDADISGDLHERWGSL